MSSSDYRPSSRLHRVNLHSHGKRPFEECGGYDSDPDNSMPIQPTTSGTSSSSNNHHFPATVPPSGPHNPETRNKRARSTSSSSTDDSSNPSSTGYNTAQSSSHSDLSDGPSAHPVHAVDCPIRPVASPTPFVSTQDVHMSDLRLPALPMQPQRTHVPSPPVPEDTLRTSLQRFAEFDRQIAALRTSLAATRSSPLPPFGPSVDGDSAPSNGHWHPNSSSFHSNGPSGPPPTTDRPPTTMSLAPGEMLNPLPTFVSSNDSAVATSTASGGVPSAPFPPIYGNTSRCPPYPSYRPSVGGSSSLVAHGRVGEPITSSPTSAFMRPSTNENTTRMGARSSSSVGSSAAPSTSHVRRIRGSLSPLVLPSDSSSFSPTSSVTDDTLLRYRALDVDVDSASGRSQRRGVDSPVPSQDREVSSSRLEEHLVAGSAPQSRFGDRGRVIREHPIEREPVPSVFDVFDIGGSSRDQTRPPSSRGPVVPRYASVGAPTPPRVPGSHNERSRGPVPITTGINTNQVTSLDTHTRLNSSWTSIPSSNSLMSESASERRHALALERFRARGRQSSFEADESENRWPGSLLGARERENPRDPGVASPVLPSSGVESMPTGVPSSYLPLLGTSATRASQSTANDVESMSSMSFQRSLSDLFSETPQRIASEERTESWLLDWDVSRVAEQERQSRERERQLEREQQREMIREWERELERQRERQSQDNRGRSFTSGSTRPTMSSAREEPSRHPVPTLAGPLRSSLGQHGTAPNTTASNTTATATTANNSQQYSYSNLNLSSFQSGLFRDSLRRNAEVDQVSFSSSVPAISSAASRVGFEDSGSEMDLDDFMRTRPPSPEWSRPHPYAGRTPPPPDYSPPPRSLTLRPGFSVLRRGSVTGYDSPGRSQHPNRNAFSGPVRPAPSGSARPTSYENNHRPSPPERAERDRFLPTRILESFYRSHEDGRRNISTATGQPHRPSNQNHTLVSGSAAVSRDERTDIVGGPRSAIGNGNRPGTEVASENRRTTLGLGGSIRSRLARFANSQSSSNATHTSPSSRQRSPSRPIGARPQEQHRRRPLVFGSTNMVEQESRSDARGVSGPSHWAVNGGPGELASVATRDVPWRASAGPRNAFDPSPSTASSPARAEIAEEQRSHLRTLRQRFQLDRESMRVFRPGMLRAGFGRRGNLGDYVPDELFDDSYEALLSLSNMLGEVRSRATPEEVIASLPTGTFKEWKKEDSETRCPICLDDYEPSDIVTKLLECPHWLHKHCLEQWLRTANTCPVCREEVKTSPKPAPTRRRAHRYSSNPSETNHGTSSSTLRNGGRSPHVNAQTQSNGGRPVSFATMVFDRMTNDGRDMTAERWPSSTSPGVPRLRDVGNVFVERIRAQQQQRTREQPPYMQELPYHLRVSPPSQSGAILSRPPANIGIDAMDGPGARPTGVVSLLRGQGSDTGAGTNPSSGMVIDDVSTSHEATGRRSMAGTNGGPGTMFLDMSAAPRRESIFPFVPPSSGAFGSGSGPTPSSVQQQHQQTSFEAHGHGPTIVIPNSRESSSGQWRSTRAYDGSFNAESTRSSSSGSGSSSSSGSQPWPITNRIPIEEDSPFEDYIFGWQLRLGQFGGESTRRWSGESA